MVVTHNDVKNFFSFSFLESNKKSNAGLLKQIDAAVRVKQFNFFFGLNSTFTNDLKRKHFFFRKMFIVADLVSLNKTLDYILN